MNFDALRPLLPHLISTNAVLAYVGFLLLVFAWNLARFWLGLRAVRNGIEEGLRHVQSLKDGETLEREFPAVSRRLEANPVMADSWREFTECLIYPGTPGDGIRNSRDPGEYFHTEAIIDRRLSVRYYNSIPNILTGLGILGTFVGLAAGVGIAQGNLASGDIEETKRALIGLLQGASLAFVTSITGLSLSLLFLGIERRSLGRLKSSLHEFVRRLDGLLQHVTPERILTEQLGELKIQSDQLRRFNTDLAVSIAGALDERLSQSLAPALDRLLDAVRELGQRQQSSSEETIRALVAEFRTSMSQSTGAEFEKIASTLSSLDRALWNSTEELTSREKELRSTMELLLRQTQETMSRGSEQMREDLAAGIRDVLESVGRTVGDMQAAFLEGQGRLSGTLDESAARLRAETEEGVKQASGTLSAAAAGMASQFEEAATRLTGQVSGAASDLGVQIGQLEGHLVAVNQLVNAVQGAAAQLTVASDRSVEVTRRMGELQQVLREASRDFAQGGQMTLDGALAVREATASVRQAVERLEQSQSAVTQSWTAYRERFEGLDASLRGSLEQLDAGLQRYAERTRTYTTDMDRQLGQAVDLLGGLVLELTEALEDHRASPGNRP